MANEVISYIEMCRREGSSLQRGMNFMLGDNHSVILMSRRPDAQYRDRVEDDGATLVYEGHDTSRSAQGADPKGLDQPETTSNGTVTENGKFSSAAQAYRRGERPAHRVRVYEKIMPGIWSYNGLFCLTDAWREHDGKRNVFRFRLESVEDDTPVRPSASLIGPRRVVPTAVKLEVWRRDKGRCVICGATEELHFDHIIPYSRGGSSMTAENVQLLCARHNLSKGDQLL